MPLVATIAALLAAEIVIAVVAPQPTWTRLLDGRARHFALLSVFEPCDYLPFRLRAGASDWIEGPEYRHHWRINSAGMRAPEQPLERGHDEYRIVALGDSFTAGQGVLQHETWPALLQGLLRKEKSNARVINAGYACGHSPDCYYAYLARNVERLAPDAVVIALFAGNDSFEPIDHFYPEVDRDGLPLRVLSRSRYVDEVGRRRMADSSRPLAYQFPVLRDSHLWQLCARALSSPVGLEGYHSPRHREYSASMEVAYRRSVDSLRGIHRLLSARNVPLIVAIIPECFQVDTSIDNGITGSPDEDRELPQRRWLSDLTELSPIDLRRELGDYLQSSGNSIWSVYYPLDRHFRPLGQELLAEAIARSFANQSDSSHLSSGRSVR